MSREKNKNILIFGGAGFIGRNLNNKLKKKYNIYIFDLPIKIKKYKRKIKNAFLINGDVCRKSDFLKIKKIHYHSVYFLAAVTSTSEGENDPEKCIAVNINGLTNFYNWAIKNKPRNVIYSSSMAIYGKDARFASETDCIKPVSLYGISKLLGELLLKKLKLYKINVQIFRLFNVYGPGQDMKNLNQGMLSIFLSQVLNHKKAIVKGPLNRIRDFVYVDDVIEALTLNFKGSNVLNVGSGYGTSVSKLLHLIFGVLQIPKKIEIAKGFSEDTFVSYANIKKIKKIYSWRPKVKLKNGIKKMIEINDQV